MGTTHRLTRTLLSSLLTVTALTLASFSPAHAEDPIKTTLDASEARDFIGTWTLAMDMMGRVMNFEMKIIDIDGKAGASFDSERQPEPVAVEEMNIGEDGKLNLTYDMAFGAQTFSLLVVAGLSDDGLEGVITEKSGLFEAPFTAVESVDDPETGEQRRRNRRMSATAATLRFESEKIRITFADIETESKDYEHFQELANNEVFEYVGGRACKILTDVDLTFGDTVIKEGNAHPTYPGVYSIWMKKSGNGWKLVFNEESDVWGTMFNPETQVAEVDLVESASDEEAAKYLIKMDKSDDTTGNIVIHWGAKKYTATFTVELPVEDAS